MDGFTEVDGVRIGQGLGRFVEGHVMLLHVGDRLRLVHSKLPYAIVGTTRP